MNTTAPGFLARPTIIASAIVSLGTLVLPTASRDRYREEFRAELSCLPPGRQLTEAAGLLAGTLALRHALKEKTVTITPPSAHHLACRVGRHHYRLLNDDNLENRKAQHLECTNCGKIKEIGPDYAPPDAKWLAGGAGMG